MDDLADVLIRRGGVAPEQIIRILDPEDPMRLGLTIAEAVEHTEDVLLVHYVGHGFLSETGELYLATRSTDPRPGRLEHSAMHYPAIRRSVQDSPARATVIVLDCCFSGRAANALSAIEPINLADVHGAFVLTSSARDETSLAPPGQRHTAFTGELIRLLDQGDPDGPPELSVRYVHRRLDHNLRARGLPRPRQLTSEFVDDLVLAPNAAWNAQPTRPSRPPVPVVSPRPRRKPLRPRPWLATGLVMSLLLPLGTTRWMPPLTLGLSITLLSAVVLTVKLRATRWWFLPATGLLMALSFFTALRIATAPPALNTCEERRELDGCGTLPGQRTSLDADGNLVTLIRNGDTLQRYSQADSHAPVTKKGDIDDHGGSDPVVLPNARGQLVAFSVSADGRLRYNPHVDTDVPASEVARDWMTIGGRDLVGQPAAAQDGHGSLVVVARDRSGALQEIHQQRPDGGWAAPVVHRETTIRDDPSIHLDGQRHLRVFALGSDEVTHVWAQSSTDENQWVHHPIEGTKLATTPSVALDAAGLLHLSARGTDNSLRHTVESSPAAQDWHDWAVGPGPYEDRPIAAADRNGTVNVATALDETPVRVGRTSLSASTAGNPRSTLLGEPMNTLFSLTLDRHGTLVAQGMFDGSVVSDSW